MRTDTKTATLTKWGGWSCVVIAIGHTVLLLTMSGGHVPGWLAGDLQWGIGTANGLASKVAYWSGPAGFPVPLLLLGLLAVGRAREGRAMPRYLGWTLLVWAAFNAYVGFPTGFLLVFIPAVLFVWDARSNPESRR
ncbi:MAG: DUF6463 family protein [Stackebrandtia sp.]